VRGRLEDWLAAAGASTGEAADVVLACNEACANGIVHAAESAITLVAVRRGEEIAVTVSDFGGWREPERRGYGLRLMRALMDEVEVLPGKDGTTVHMKKRLS
jgi:anti-sigma regulatory factor (Ser/Thr protein kinase)